ncbi:hypothetical protein FHR53_003471 [Xanthomonas arboricola]
MPNLRLHRCLPLGLLCALCACTGAGTHGAARPEAEHFTLANLQQLGCTVTATPKRTLHKIPLMGEVDGYGVTSTSACATHLISLLQPMTYEDAVWEGARTAAANFAKEHGFERESYEGRRGVQPRRHAGGLRVQRTGPGHAAFGNRALRPHCAGGGVEDHVVGREPD